MGIDDIIQRFLVKIERPYLTRLSVSAIGSFLRFNARSRMTGKDSSGSIPGV
jgi:hypothetical protein